MNDEALALFSEQAADREIIRSLIRQLTKELERKNEMSQFVQDTDGKLLAVHQFEELTVQKAKEYLEALKADVQKLETWLAAQVTEAPAETPADPNAQAATEAPAEPTAPADTAAEAPPAPAEPAEASQPAEAAPAEVAAPTDPNQTPLS